eukprot:TRINITY_DN9830_c0_g1_i1.p1 TRINITY_DN9830_c0_g1~~TRINITY_DN9830_c0_g1_i1.p1  ORF type:complete len:277 (-),score=47.09 TRINITY_DN9830_c0_g1_i1:230-1060(-)
MGGHGRALEALVEEVKAFGITDCSLSNLLNVVRINLERKYPDLKQYAPSLVPVLLVVLMQIHLRINDAIPNSDWTVDGVVQMGFFRYDWDLNVIMCPFILVWLLATWSKHPTLAHFQLEAYDEAQQKQDPGLPLGLQCWQHWEEFSARFQMLKSSLLQGQTIPVSQLHSGARLGSKVRDLKVVVTELKELCRASHQYSTKSPSRTNEIIHELGTVDVNACNAFVLNAVGAPAADGFCGLKIEGGAVVRELHQNKQVKKTVSLQLFLSEYKKAAAGG